VRIDRPAENDVPDARAAPDVPSPVHEREAGDSPAVRYETRDRATYHAEYRAAVEAEYRAWHGSWDATAPALREAWANHESKWPSPERPAQSPHADTPGTWRGDGGRHLDLDANAEVDRGCERIREVGENIITPAIRRIETEDKDRHLTGLEYRLKSPDRLKEKWLMNWRQDLG
jgi:hypothetical protein